MARITWQSVTAPNFSGANDQARLAAELIGSAAQNIGGGLKALDSGLDDSLSAAAKQQAMQIQDPDAWNKMMATQGIAGLGISADRANADLTSFVEGRRDTLVNQERELYNTGRARAEDIRTDEARILAEQANVLANDVGFASLSADDAKKEIIKRTEGNVKLREAALTELAGTDASAWTVDPSLKLPENVTKTTQVIGNALTERQSELDLKVASNPGLRLWDKGKTLGANGNPVGDLAMQVVNQTQLVDGEEKDKVYAETMGSMQDTFNQLQMDYPDLSPELITAAMQERLQSNGWIWSDDKLEVDVKEVRKALDTVNTPEARQALYNERNAYEAEKGALGAAKMEMDRLTQRLGMALTKGNTAEAAKIEAQLAAIQEGLAPAQAQGAMNDAEFSLGTSIPGAAPAATPVAAAGASPEQAAAAIAAAAGTTADPRVQAGQNAGQALVQASQNIDYNVGEMADDVAGLGAGAIMKLGQGLGNAYGYAASAVSPEAGARAFAAADAGGARADAMMDQGLITETRPTFDVNGSGIPEPTPPAPPLTPKQASTTINAAKKDPVTTAQAVLAEAGIDPSRMAQAEKFIAAIESGTSTWGGKLPAAEKEQMVKFLESIMEEASLEMEINGGGDPAVQTLLKTRKQWLKF